MIIQDMKKEQPLFRPSRGENRGKQKQAGETETQTGVKAA